MAAVIGNRNISLGVMGGTLITAACYGGGDVFGVTPYDKATTRYLKATYPLYWVQIRDYGFANPQVVPIINADPAAYMEPRYLILQASGLSMTYVLENSKQVKVEVYGGTSAYVSYMDVTVDGTLVYHKTQADTGFNPVNVADLITTQRVSASSDWWRVNAVAYAAYNGVCYTNGQQILHIDRTSGRTTHELVAIAPTA